VRILKLPVQVAARATLYFYHNPAFSARVEAVFFCNDSLGTLTQAPLATLYLDFDIHARGQIQTHQHINCLGIGFQNVDKAVVRPDLKVLLRILSMKVERRTV